MGRLCLPRRPLHHHQRRFPRRHQTPRIRVSRHQPLPSPARVPALRRRDLLHGLKPSARHRHRRAQRSCDDWHGDGKRQGLAGGIPPRERHRTSQRPAPHLRAVPALPLGAPSGVSFLPPPARRHHHHPPSLLAPRV